MAHVFLIAFAIKFLNHCESVKKWTIYPGYSAGTCGYTGPGIGLVIKIFQRNGIYNQATLDAFLRPRNFPMDLFIDIINETIGNFLDFAKDCPVTGVKYGMSGLLKHEKERARPDSMQSDEPPLVYTVGKDGGNLINGVNVISFTPRENGCETFHHATLYTRPENDECFIIDSWSTDSRALVWECRPLTCRQFSFTDVIRQIDRLNSDDILQADMTHIFEHYFLAHPTFLTNMENFGRVTVSTVSSKYIEEVYDKCEQRIKDGQTKSDFGGKLRKKRNKKTRKLNKSKSKK
jgi:hypothetical protein